MSIERYPSKLLENAINEFARLPGIGRKSALRLVLHLLRQSGESVTAFSESLVQLRNEVKYCSVCHNISDAEVCEICSNPSRNRSEICVVENIHDVMLIENTHQYNGLYHVLGGIISPMDGVGPGELEIDSLTERAGSSDVKEIIMALPTTMEGDTTSFYIFRKLKNKPVRITTLARGVAIGDDLEYTDEITLGRSLTNRVLYESSMGK